MIDFYIRVFIYFVCFVLSLFALNALDFNRFLKQGKVIQGQLLYFILACSLAYLMGSLMTSIIYIYSK